MSVPRLNWVLSQIGFKPGGRAQLARCLSEADLPESGRPWRRTDQRTWRTGTSSRTQQWSADAKAAGSMTAWRSFESAQADRYLWVQLVPLAKAEDGPDALASVTSQGLRNRRAEVTVVSSRDVQPAPSVPTASLVAASEQQTAGPRGSSEVLNLHFVVGSALVVMAASSSGAGWTWPDLLGCAEMQARRLAR